MDLEKVPRYKDLTKEAFQESFLKPHLPVIIEGFSKDWKAWDKWSYEYFKKVAGSHTVDLYGSWQYNNPNSVEREAVKRMEFGEYLNLIESKPTDLRIFLFNLFEAAPELKKDINYPDYVDHWITQMPFLFFGGEGSDVRFHYDIDFSHVFITQLFGKKKITLFKQNQNELLYRLPYTTHSVVDLGDTDYDRFPALQYAKGWVADLDEGDTLFMPGGMWHYIQYITQGASISLRALNKNPKELLEGAFNVFMGRKLDTLFEKYIPNWASYKNQKAFEAARDAIAEEHSN